MADPRIQLYQNFSTLLDSGVPLLRALEVVRNSARGRCKRAMRIVEADVRTGRPLSESMNDHRCFKPLDIGLIATGEETGQLAEVAAELGRWYEFCARMRSTIIGGLAYPALLIHSAAFIAPLIPAFLAGFNFDHYWQDVFGILAVFYVPLLVVLGIIYLTPRRGPLRMGLDKLLLMVPALGSAIKKLSASRYSTVFSMMYGGGIPILKAARQAPDACGNMIMARRFEGGAEAVERGQNMSEGFPRSLGEDFICIWQVGEESGDLDRSAARLGSRLAEEAERRITLIAQLLPRIIYILLVLYVGFMIAMALQQIFGGALTEF